MTRGVLVTLFGAWVLCQLFGGEMIQRLGIAGTAGAGTITESSANLNMPSGEDSAARRDAAAKAAAPSPAPVYSGPNVHRAGE